MCIFCAYRILHWCSAYSARWDWCSPQQWFFFSQIVSIQFQVRRMSNICNTAMAGSSTWVFSNALLSFLWYLILLFWTLWNSPDIFWALKTLWVTSQFPGLDVGSIFGSALSSKFNAAFGGNRDCRGRPQGDYFFGCQVIFINKPARLRFSVGQSQPK